ncbi:uncharacterized protein LOC131671861 isoform X2 [Phymastichus coffea]|nr:uncharacterized protein LOC131671861 isoform X2 [Phymastichus coffea]
MMIKTSVLTKLIMACLYQTYRQNCYEKMVQHFKEITDQSELKVLISFSDRGLRYAVVYLAATALCGGVYLTLPIQIMCFDYFLNPNTTELEKILPVHVEYFVDYKKYYNYIIFHILCYMTSVFVVIIPYDLAYILEIRHIAALFTIIKMRLKRSSATLDVYEKSKYVSASLDNEVNAVISEAIILHNEAFEMINLIEDTNNVGMVGILFQNMILFGACPFLLSVHLNRPMEFSRYTLMYILISLHFWVIFTHGQMIIDCSSSIFDTCYEFQWYYLTKKSSKLIYIMMTRTVLPSEVTGGKLFILSMETYGQMVKTGLSLFTIFKSLGI